MLLKGYAAGLAIAALLTAFATGTRIGADLLETLTAMFNPLPSIALLPLALVWFGLGAGSVIFVLIHAVLRIGGVRPTATCEQPAPACEAVGHLAAGERQSLGLAGKQLARDAVALGEEPTDRASERVSSRVRDWRAQQIRGRIAGEHIHDPGAAELRHAEHGAGRFLANLANDRGLATSGRGAQNCQRVVGLPRRDHHEELAFVGDVQRIEPQQLAGAAHFIAHWDAILFERDAQATVAREFVQRRRDAASRWIAHPADAVSDRSRQRVHQRPYRTRIGTEVAFQIDVPTSEEDRNPVIADGTRECDPRPDRAGDFHAAISRPIPAVVT
jgi:hypothetical protein